ncbi:MAG: DUF1302 domain-containing protein [Glaciimonas sp.]|nr:DUF1302 domain-containing protein [Glaciimonas sp.]
MRMKYVTQAVLGAAVCMGLVGSAQAFEIDTGSDAKLRWDNTLKYSVGVRLMDPSAKVTNGDPGGPPPGPQLDDGDRNFKKGGLMTNRVDWFTELDGSYKNFGFRVSGAAWFDEVYRKSNANTSQSTINSLSVPAGQFPAATADLMGRKAELLDAFVAYKNDPDSNTPFNVRLGKHTVLYGESLFFGANGIANAQAPVDLIKLLQVPGSQFKEIIRPVNQISTQVQLSPNVSMGAYYQLKWEQNRIPPSGSYLSDVDFVGVGSESVLGMQHVGDLNAKNSGQGGVQLRFKPEGGTVEYGLYAAQYNDKGPQIMLSPGFIPGGSNTYRVVYPEGVKTFGASFSTVFGPSNVSGEVSLRTNAPIVSAPQTDIPLAGNGSDNPLYAVGRTAHAQISSVTLFGRSPIWDGAVFLNELAWNRRLSIQQNPLAIDPNVTRDAWAFRMILEPQYFQVVSGVDLSVPIGLGYNPSGRSSSVFKFNGGAEKGGDFSIGLNANIQNQYKVGVNWVHFFGPENAFLTPNTNTAIPGPFMSSGAQSLHDRDFLTVSLQSTF